MGYNSGNAGAARAEEERRAAQIKQGMGAIDETFNKFDDSFYQQRAQGYNDFALPKLGQQHQETKRNLAYSLARSGLGNSGVAAERGAELEQRRGEAVREVTDAGLAGANSLRRDVEQNRSQQVAQLQSSADPSAAAQAAIRSAAAFDTPQTFQPIGNFFEDWSRTYLANQTARQYNPAVQPMFSFGGGGSSQTIVN